MLASPESPALQEAPELALNQGQRDAADEIFKFLFSNDKAMGISGPGGVGKTFLMSYVIDTVIPRYHETCQLMGMDPLYNSVVMTATTHKAAEQLAQATGRPTETIHSFINLKVADDFSTGKSKLVRKKDWFVHQNLVIFIDECSMIDRDLYNQINDATMNCKIIYVGDHCQLAPVMETLSPIYRQGIKFVQLTEPMRTKVPALHAINNQLRNTVETGVFQPIQLVPGIIDYCDNDQMQEEIQRQFHAQTSASRILAFTNERVIDFNNHIRAIRRLPDHYTVGEKLVNNGPVHLSRSMLNAETEVEILKIANTTEMLHVDRHNGTDIELEVRLATIRTSIGQIYEDVKLPEDRNHFIDLIKWFASHKNWNRYFYLKNNFPELRPRDASTVYKAQGSTFDVTFIDLGNISTCHNPQQAARMLYVAFSRSRHRVVLYGDLAEKYGGLLAA